MLTTLLLLRFIISLPLFTDGRGVGLHPQVGQELEHGEGELGELETGVPG